jgi:hypothetical protein
MIRHPGEQTIKVRNRDLFLKKTHGIAEAKNTNTHTHNNNNNNKHAKKIKKNPTKILQRRAKSSQKKASIFSPEFVFLVVSTIETDLATNGKTPSWGRQQQPQSGELRFRTGLEGGGKDIVESV